LSYRVIRRWHFLRRLLRMITRLVSQAAVIGVAATIALAAPASAAAKPTIKGPSEVKGYAQFTLTGTADPGTTVQLYETAYVFGVGDLQPADDWEHGGGPVTAKADTAGKFSITRWLDSGFYFQVRQGAVKSDPIIVKSRIAVTFWVTSPANGQLVANGSVSPAQPGLKVHIQKKAADGTFATVRSIETISQDDGQSAGFATTFTGLAHGEHTYRAIVDGDTSNAVLGATSESHATHVTGVGQTGPATGTVIFSRIQYDAPGTDSGSNGSLNTEFFKLKNTTKANINLNGWTVRDQQNIVYKFPSLTLRAGSELLVHSGKGTTTAINRYWGRAGKNGYVWNNSGETAYLRTAANKQIDTCKWTKVSPGTTNC